ncbi:MULTISPECIES: GNAT family N-acetyltransferase [unclassified Marinobacterium]|uniref:GNAT family N-acetyltransferase n=1 Tax=unclassified Marinobacterium TaxID=2644139 RepID=UPI00156A26D3|nr:MULTISPECIES: GNAT family N-acetyltransferase [unclassified Marinobacterium]NRP53631.1 putative acetyltransferase [Marinobacterium sp. xm-v-242]NRP77881.1 putative acetyltransferase [Marinobacterium sp. xm-m-383]
MISFDHNRAKIEEIVLHLEACDDSYEPPLSERVDLKGYAAKIFFNADRFEAWSDGTLVGLVACYMNNQECGFITDVSVQSSCRGLGIADKLLKNCFELARGKCLCKIILEVNENNHKARSLYLKLGFVSIARKKKVLQMTKSVNE